MSDETSEAEDGGGIRDMVREFAKCSLTMTTSMRRKCQRWAVVLHAFFTRRIDQATCGSNDMVTRTVPFGRTYQSDGSRSRSPARRPVVARAAVARAGGTPQPRRRRGIIGELLDYSDEVRRARDAVALVTGTLPPRRRRSIIGQLIDYHREVIRLNELVQQLGSRAVILVPDLPPSTLVTPRVTVATQTEPGVWSPVSGIQLGVVADAPSSDEDAEPLSIEELRSFILRYYELHPEMEPRQ